MMLLAMALAFAPGPYKLVITWGDGGVVAIDYPSSERCEAARRAVIAEGKRRTDEAARNAPDGAVMIAGPRVPTAFCIPG